MLEDLSIQLTPIAKAELEVLQRMKDPSGSHFYLWDFDYYHDQILRNNYQVDHDMIAEYFPSSVTIHCMLDIIEEIFSLKIENLTGRTFGLSKFGTRTFGSSVYRIRTQ